METSNHCCCQNPGLKLGHNKTQTTSISVSTSVSTVASGSQADSTNATGAGQKRIFVPGYATIFTPSSDKMRGNFKLPGYEPTTLQSLPVSPQILFQKNQLLNMLKEFSQHMYDSMLQNNIQLPSSLSLGLNAMGNINVLGVQPDQAKIESLFGSNPSLATQFHQIAFTSRVQQLANLQPDFTNAFFQQPSNSLQQINFVQIRARILGPFQITINPPSSASNTSSTNASVTAGTQEASNPVVDTQAPQAQGMPFHLQVSNSGNLPATTPIDTAPAPVSASTVPTSAVSVPVLPPTTTTVPGSTAASPSAADTQDPAAPAPQQVSINDPVPPINVQPQAPEGDKQHAGKNHQAQSLASQHRFTINDPKPPVATKANPHKEVQPHYVRDIKEMGIINS